MNKAMEIREKIDSTINDGPFKANWQSLEHFQVPDWYVNGKFGIVIISLGQKPCFLVDPGSIGKTFGTKISRVIKAVANLGPPGSGEVAGGAGHEFCVKIQHGRNITAFSVGISRMAD